MHHVHDTKLCDDIIRHCMTLEHLATFSLLINKYSAKDLQASNLNNLRPNKSIKKLIFENETRDNNNLLVALLRSLPNLRHLELACEYDDEILAQLLHMTKLIHLKLTDYHQGLLKAVKCSESLESISVKYCKLKTFQ
jgi:hypothetical protein